jgi:DNA-binding FadR family transcriptional regulator
LVISTSFESLPDHGTLHDRVTQLLARRVIESEGKQHPVVFPKEAELCQQLGVSRTVLRESMKVLADKGMVEMKPRVGTHARPSSAWRLLDPDILTWQAQAHPDSSFLRNLCEVRLALEPTAAGFAAVRASGEEIEAIVQCLDKRATHAQTAAIEEIIDLDLQFHGAVVMASHNPLLQQLNAVIHRPLRIALSCTARFRSTVELGLEAHYALLDALRRHDPLASRRAAEQVVGLAMLAVERVIRAEGIEGGPAGERGQ